MKYLLTMICAILLLCGCNNDDETNANTDSKDTVSRTVIVYMNADNNLSSAADDNVNDMCIGSANIGTKENLIVFFDNSNTKTKPCIYRISGGTKTVVKQYDEDFVSTDPKKMEDVLQWIITNYPANSYGLTIWGHATGWLVSNDTVETNNASEVATKQTSNRKKAIGVDYNTDDSQCWLNITTLNNILEDLPKFKFIFFDCCDMQNVESAYELRNRTEYYIGSPAEIPFYGAPYDLIVSDFFDATDNVGKKIVDEYYNYYSDYYLKKEKDSLSSVPLSVIKTSELESLASVTASKLATFMPTVGRYPLELSTDSIVYYFRSSSINIMFDMQGLMYKYLSSEDFAEWKAQYDKTVIYQRMCKKWYSYLNVNFNDFSITGTNCGCMSMFVPLMSYQNYTGELQFNEKIRNFSWYSAVGWSNYGW